MLVLPALLAASSALAFPGTYELVPGWPMDLGKIGPMNGTSGVDVDPVRGEVYMCQQRGNPRVSVWDEKTGKLLRSWGDDELDTPHGIRIKMPLDGSSAPEIWVADMGVGKPDTGNVIKAFTPEGKLLHTVGQVGKSGAGLSPLQFGNVADLDWNPDQSKMVIVDGDGGPNNRAVELDAKTHDLVRSWGGLGETNGKFHISHGVAIDKCNRVWIADRANNRTQTFTMDGKWLASWTCMAEPPYGVRMFGASEDDDAAGVSTMLVTGGGNGVGVGKPGFVNRLEVLSFKSNCSAPADLGECTVAYSWPVDPDSTAHFSAISEVNKNVFLCEVSTNKFKKYAFKPL